MNKNTTLATGKTGYDFGYMIVHHPSVLHNAKLNSVVIRGNINKSIIEVAMYRSNRDIRKNLSSQHVLHIQPKTPFSINYLSWRRAQCIDVNVQDFTVINPLLGPENLDMLKDLKAVKDSQKGKRVYKVYNTSTERKLNFEIPRDRSVFEFVFPRTTVVNDDSFSGSLLQNRTFWTIKLSGRVTTCPGYLNIRMADQDQPNMDVYHYDIGKFVLTDVTTLPKYGDGRPRSTQHGCLSL